MGAPFVYDIAAVNIMFEGNSLVAGAGASAGKKLPEQLSLLAPLSGIPVKNFGIGGSTWEDNISMTARSKAVDDWYVSGKTNVLLLWEGTNTAANTSAYTGNDIGEKARRYVAARKAAHPDLKIIMLNTIPRHGLSVSYNGDYVGLNNTLIAFNNYLSANWQDMGIDVLVDTRASDVFVFSGTQYISPKMSPYVGDLVHCNDAGYGLIAQMCADALITLATQLEPPDPPGATKTSIRLTHSGRPLLYNGRPALLRS